jgi:hypothetical protein
MPISTVSSRAFHRQELLLTPASMPRANNWKMYQNPAHFTLVENSFFMSIPEFHRVLQSNYMAGFCFIAGIENGGQ